VSTVRLNASHFALSDLEGVLVPLKMMPVKIMLDLPGQEHRISGFKDAVQIMADQRIEIGNRNRANLTSFKAWSCLEPGMTALIQDGSLEASVVSTLDDGAVLQFKRGGILRPNAHLHFPDLAATDSALSEQDQLLIQIALKHGLDQIALSHVRHPDTVRQARKLIDASTSSHHPELVVKIETKEALEQIDELIGISDVVLLGRGDLGSVLPVWEIPLTQRRLAELCALHGKPLYLATQTLSSLAHGKTPSRADVSDIVFALMDGVAGITLTDETVLSDDPGLAVGWCKSIIEGVTKSYLANPQSSADALQAKCQEAIRQLSSIGPLIWQRGWAEANAGNVSMRLTDFGNDPLQAVTYLVSRTGSRYRQFAHDPMKSLLLIEATGSDWRSLIPSVRPSSEWMAHLSLHQLFRHSGRNDRVILHAHPAAVIAISHFPIFKDERAFNADLAEVLPELPLYLREGVCCCPAQAPGSLALAEASVRHLDGRKAMIWEKHGLLCFGESLDEAFDYMEIVVKACEIWLRLRDQAPLLS